MQPRMLVGRKARRREDVHRNGGRAGFGAHGHGVAGNDDRIGQGQVAEIRVVAPLVPAIDVRRRLQLGEQRRGRGIARAPAGGDEQRAPLSIASPEAARPRSRAISAVNRRDFVLPPTIRAMRGRGSCSNTGAHWARAVRSTAGVTRWGAPTVSNTLGNGGRRSCRGTATRSKSPRRPPGSMIWARKAARFFLLIARATGAVRRPAAITRSGHGGTRAARLPAVSPRSDAPNRTLGNTAAAGA